MWGEGRALWETSGLSAESRPLGFAAGPVLNSQLSPGPLLDTCLPWAFTGCLPPLGLYWKPASPGSLVGTRAGASWGPWGCLAWGGPVFLGGCGAPSPVSLQQAGRQHPEALGLPRPPSS